MATVVFFCKEINGLKNVKNLIKLFNDSTSPQ